MEDTLFTPDLINADLGVGRENFLKFANQFRQMIMLYENAIRLVKVRLEILESENKAHGNHTIIRSIISRIKEPMSINRKLQKLNAPISIPSIIENLNDVAGIRVVCGYISDIYAVRDELLKDGFLKLIQEKDYIKNPKPNGYRSLHLILAVNVPLNENLQSIKCEVQLRTTAMDSWAALEHQMRYKKEVIEDEEINRKLLHCADLLAQTDEIMQEMESKLSRQAIET